MIAEQKIGIVHFVPSMLEFFIQQPKLVLKTESIQHIICSGEALPINLANDTLRLIPSAKLHNLYGPTEASVDVSY